VSSEAVTPATVQGRPQRETADYQAAADRLRRAALYATNDGCKQFLQLAQLYETLSRANEALEKSRELLGCEPRSPYRGPAAKASLSQVKPDWHQLIASNSNER
jgi:hypothetical protein